MYRRFLINLILRISVLSFRRYDVNSSSSSGCQPRCVNSNRNPNLNFFLSLFLLFVRSFAARLLIHVILFRCINVGCTCGCQFVSLTRLRRVPVADFFAFVFSLLFPLVSIILPRFSIRSILFFLTPHATTISRSRAIYPRIFTMAVIPITHETTASKHRRAFVLRALVC